MIFIYLLGIIGLIIIYQRYFPVFGVPAVSKHTVNKDVFILDLRNYQSTYNDPIQGSLNIPYSYLKRYSKEIPKKELFIIASDFIEKNLAIRFLLKRKFSIYGFIILDQKNKEGVRNWSIISKQKTG
jgi:rhodanese-related sulfurtransferase